MNLRQDIQELKTGPRELRKFGLTVGGVFALLGALQFLRHKHFYPYFLTPGLLLVLLGAVAPKILKPVYLAWMTLAFVLGFVVSHVLLLFFFFCIVTPIGLVARWCGSDFLDLKLKSSAASYWVPRERKARTPADYERQY